MLSIFKLDKSKNDSKQCFSKDLMLPGVVVPSCGIPEVKQGDCCGITIVNNRYVLIIINEKYGNTSPTFFTDITVTLLSWLFAELLLQLAQLQCPVLRCTVWV